MGLDAVLLARIQFAFTISFHIIFPAFTIGLASWLAVLEYKWLTTKQAVYAEIYHMWVKIFAVCFGLGVVSGVVMSYQFGTNWSAFSLKVGSILSPLLGYEVLTAFFLEASFLGIMLFGWRRVSPAMHFTSTVIVAVGTLISAFWILSANSWMQTPAGYAIAQDGKLIPTSWMAIIFNPSFPWRFMHMITAAYLTTAFVVAGVAGYYLWKKRHEKHAKIMLGMAMIIAFFFSPIQAVIGDFHGLNTFEHQPIKVAAMEGIWETEEGAALRLFALPNEKTKRNDFEITIPKLASLILTHDLNGKVRGLNHWPAEEHPPVAPVFWSFRVMVSIGLLMIATGLVAGFLYWRHRLFTCRLFHRWCLIMAPSGFIAVLAGWFVTEIGRQPYSAYGILRTSDSASPVLPEAIAFSLLAFIIVYSIVFGAGVYYIFKLVKAGPKAVDKMEKFYEHGTEHSFSTALSKELK